MLIDNIKVLEIIILWGNMLMKKIQQDIFRAIHEGKWLKIEYKNKKGQITKYWIGIKNLNVAKKALSVEGMHIERCEFDEYDTIYIDSIISTTIIEGSYCPVNQILVKDIAFNPHKFKTIFDNIANIKILNYLEICNRMDTTPYYSDFKLIEYIDRESFNNEGYQLSDEQFKEIVKKFENKLYNDDNKVGKISMQQLAMNVMSINTNKGLYVLAYRKLKLDVRRKVLRPSEDITICTEYTIDNKKQTIRSFLDADDYELLKDFKNNQEKIKDCITHYNKNISGVDDMPYVIGIGRDGLIDLHTEYQAIIKMYEENRVTFPIRAFFGDLLERPRRLKTYPIALLNGNINLDQLLAINNAMKNPIAYIQGPPGTGKTNTIINTIITAFFNERTVLFSSYNNIPLDGVFQKLTSLKYKDKTIPFPVLRVGNADKVKESLVYIKKLYEMSKDISVYEDTLDKRKDNRKEKSKQLSNLLKKYEEILDLKEREETLNRIIESQEKSKNAVDLMSFQIDLQGRQLNAVRSKLKEIGDITENDALSLLDNNDKEFYQYLYYTSARYIKKLGTSRFSDLMDIIYETDNDLQIKMFNKYLSKRNNVKKLQSVFPIIITTCISAHKIGEPIPMFDMVIMDEASQCNTAISLVPIIRGNNLMLVGDPQQLRPVILLDELNNQQLRRKYKITDEYDYRENSIYKTFLACDSVSDEVLLHNHYRCNRKIIEFNNKKYYNSKLSICSNSSEKEPLVYIDIQNSTSNEKNTSPAEVEEIIRYAKDNRNRSIGVITPFVNQRSLLESKIKEFGLENVVCGTVHAFQGDEKEVVLFSTAITEQTQSGTYEWLKNNKELINVATSRAKDKLIILADYRNVKRLHKGDNDDLYELIEYVRNNGNSEVTQKYTNSRALGVKPFSTKTEEAFMENLNHALGNIWLSQKKYEIKKEVAISHVFNENTTYDDLFYMGRFDFVIYEKQVNYKFPILAIELDGKEHYEDEVVKERDARKNNICEAHNLQLIRVENSYARRYNYIKEILYDYFKMIH